MDLLVEDFLNWGGGRAWEGRFVAERSSTRYMRFRSMTLLSSSDLVFLNPAFLSYSWLKEDGQK